MKLSLALQGALVALAAAALWGSFQARHEQTNLESAVTARLTALERTLDRVGENLDRLERQRASLGSPLLTRAVQSRSDAELPSASGSDLPAIPEDEPAGATTPGGDQATVQEFAEILEGVFAAGQSMQMDLAAHERFWELARSTGVLKDLIEDLEAKVNKRPGDLDARLELADAYVAKLLTVPIGPERGVWGTKAESEWQEVLRQDDRNWEAQFKLAESLSYYPDFLGRGPEALASFERTREIQESGPTRKEHAQTYLSLSRLYQRSSQPERAVEALRSGLQRHPTSNEIQQALAALEK